MFWVVFFVSDSARYRHFTVETGANKLKYACATLAQALVLTNVAMYVSTSPPRLPEMQFAVLLLVLLPPPLLLLVPMSPLLFA